MATIIGELIFNFAAIVIHWSKIRAWMAQQKYGEIIEAQAK